MAVFILGIYTSSRLVTASAFAASEPPATKDGTNTEPSAAAINAPAPGTNAAANVKSEPKFEVEDYDVQGNTLLSQKTIDSIFAEAKGKEVTLTQIRKALAALQTAYRERGFATVAVALPQQQITNATVRVQVTEAPLVALNVVNNRYYSSNNIIRALPHLEQAFYWTNFMLNSFVLQRELDVANANRDRQIYPVLGPGPEPGTSELTLKVKDRLPLHGRIELNNDYTPGTPPLRFNFNAQYGNLWHLEHQFGATYSFSPQETKANTMHSTTPFDDPLISSY